MSWVWQRGVQGARDDDLWETTVFVRGIDKSLRETDVCRVLAAVYPGEVQGVAMVLDTTRSQQLKQARKRKEVSKYILRRHINAISIHIHTHTPLHTCTPIHLYTYKHNTHTYIYAHINAYIYIYISHQL